MKIKKYCDMKKFVGKTILPLVAAMLVFCGCSKSNRFEVTLNLDNAEGITVYLCKTVEGADVVVDSAVVVDRKAVLTAPFDDPQIVYSIKYDVKDQCGVFTFFTENQNTTIAGERDNMPRWTVKGCATMDELMAHHDKCIELFEDRILAAYAEMETAFQAGDTVKIAEINAQLQPLVKDYHNYQADFIRKHADSYLGHYMLDIMKNDLDLEVVKELAASFTTESVYSNNVKKYIENGGQTEHTCCTAQ